jgi:hypothetical protein
MRRATPPGWRQRQLDIGLPAGALTFRRFRAPHAQCARRGHRGLRVLARPRARPRRTPRLPATESAAPAYEMSYAARLAPETTRYWLAGRSLDIPPVPRPACPVRTARSSRFARPLLLGLPPDLDGHLVNGQRDRRLRLMRRATPPGWRQRQLDIGLPAEAFTFRRSRTPHTQCARRDHHGLRVLLLLGLAPDLYGDLIDRQRDRGLRLGSLDPDAF